MDDSQIEVRPVTPERWGDLEDLFVRAGPRGGRPPTAWCWCMWWRDRSHDVARNRAAMSEIVAAGRQPGLLAYVGGEPAGWIAVAPRHEYGQLLRSPTLRPLGPDENGVFAVVCFYVHPSARRRGVARRLLRGAVEHARGRGASAVEAYAADRLGGTSSTDFMGVVDWFVEEGFHPVRRARSKTVVRFQLRERGEGAGPAAGAIGLADQQVGEMGRRHAVDLSPKTAQEVADAPRAERSRPNEGGVDLSDAHPERFVDVGGGHVEGQGGRRAQPHGRVEHLPLELAPEDPE